MIRREASTAADANAWFLISQIDHARLAHRLAEHWGAVGFAPLAGGDELLWAVEHHDDGWHDWELSPDAEPNSLAPRSFTEMEVSDSLAIWTGSILAAARRGPLAGYVVSGHFAALARRAAAANGGGDHRLVERFLTVQDELMARSLVAWRALDPVANTPTAARRALAQLQFFDLFSLWFCCAEAAEPDQVEPPGGPELTLTPISTTEIHIAPWPFAIPDLELEVAARRVPRVDYQNRQQLALAPSQPVRLHWMLRAAV